MDDEAEVQKLRRDYQQSLRRLMNAYVGGNIGRRRLERRMTQAHLGQALGATLSEPWSAQTVSYVERGRRELSPVELLAFAAALGEPASRFLLLPQGEAIYAWGENWDADRVRQLVLGDEPASIQVPPPIRGEPTEEMRDELRRMASSDIDQTSRQGAGPAGTPRRKRQSKTGGWEQFEGIAVSPEESIFLFLSALGQTPERIAADLGVSAERVKATLARVEEWTNRAKRRKGARKEGSQR